MKEPWWDSVLYKGVSCVYQLAVPTMEQSLNVVKTFMSSAMQSLTGWTSDEVLFPALQIALIGFALFAAGKSARQARRAGHGGLTAQVTRGQGSMGIFYGTYAAITGVLVAVALRVEMAVRHRVLWALLDSTLVAYVCLRNPWFRNKLIGWANALTKVEVK